MLQNLLPLDRHIVDAVHRDAADPDGAEAAIRNLSNSRLECVNQ